MVRRKHEINTQVKPALFGGEGSVIMKRLLNGPEEMNNKGRVFNLLTINPGCSLGLHTHTGETETYYILSGSGVYHDDGVDIDVHPGDVCFCNDGQTHGIKALDEPIELVAMVLYS